MERSEAMNYGFKTYETGRPCRNGHLTYRYTSTGSCSMCVNGEANKTKPETFSTQADLMEMTALTTYNDGMKRLAEAYERSLEQAKLLRAKAARIAAEVEIKRQVDQRKIDAHKAEQARKAAIKTMTKVNVFIHPTDVVNAKDWILEKAREVCPDITMQDVNYRNKVQGGVLHEIRCFPQHMKLIVDETNKAYSEHTKPQSQH